MRALVAVAVGILAAGAAAIALNLLLLGYTSPPGEPVGKLSPAVPIQVVQTPAPAPRVHVSRTERDD
jgi:hypothetical protein